MITLEWAKIQLRIRNTQSDEEITRHILKAEQVLFEYLGYQSEDDFYYEYGEQHFFVIETALLLMVQVLYDDHLANPLTDQVKSMVVQYRSLKFT
jgi:hypothetical protein